MPQSEAPPASRSPGGASRLRATIIASTCTDDGVCIMCADCGHVFVPSKPLSDESQQVDNVTLSKALFYHICALGRVPQDKRKYGR